MAHDVHQGVVERIELVKVFGEKGLILQFKVQNTNATLLGQQTRCDAARELCL